MFWLIDQNIFCCRWKQWNRYFFPSSPSIPCPNLFFSSSFPFDLLADGGRNVKGCIFCLVVCFFSLIYIENVIKLSVFNIVREIIDRKSEVFDDCKFDNCSWIENWILWMEIDMFSPKDNRLFSFQIRRNCELNELKIKCEFHSI